MLKLVEQGNILRNNGKIRRLQCITRPASLRQVQVQSSERCDNETSSYLNQICLVQLFTYRKFLRVLLPLGLYCFWWHICLRYHFSSIIQMRNALPFKWTFFLIKQNKTVNGDSQSVVKLNIEEDRFYEFGEKSCYGGIKD